MSKDPVNPQIEELVRFSLRLRFHLMKIREETKDGNVSDYVDFLLQESQHDPK